MKFLRDVWPWLSHSTLTAGPRHGQVRNRAMLFQQGRVLDEGCLDCPWTIPPRPAKHNIEHIFCTCVKVRDAWRYIRGLVDRHQPELQARGRKMGGW